jgi:hypothetical protein
MTSRLFRRDFRRSHRKRLPEICKNNGDAMQDDGRESRQAFPVGATEVATNSGSAFRSA